MSSNSTSHAITKRSQDNSFMPPPPPPKKIKRPRKVLDEDAYTDALSHIIARDFFPGLTETESQQNYLNALDSHDHEWIAAAGRKLTKVMTPGPDGRKVRGRRGTSMTPITGLHGNRGDTSTGCAGHIPATVGSLRTEIPEPEINMTLGAFQNKYTSEDNESFYKLLDSQNSKRAKKHAWMWDGNKILSARQIAHRQREGYLLNTKASQTAEDGKEILRIQTPDSRKAMPGSWHVRPDNQLMFAPSSIEDSLRTTQQKAEEDSRADPKAVVYENTRLAPPRTESEGSLAPSPTISAVENAIDCHRRHVSSDSEYPGVETPRVNGYAFVDSEPLPSPDELGSDWGIADSNLLLGSGDATPNPFKIKEKSRREYLHHRMVDKVARNKRILKGESTEKTLVSVPKFPSSPKVRMEGLTPAAERLLGRIGRSPWPGPKRTPKEGSRLKYGWTPRG